MCNQQHLNPNPSHMFVARGPLPSMRTRDFMLQLHEILYWMCEHQLREDHLPESCPCCQRSCRTFQDHHLEEKRRHHLMQTKVCKTKPPCVFKTCLITFWRESSVNSNSAAHESVGLRWRYSRSQRYIYESSEISSRRIVFSLMRSVINKSSGVRED